MNYISQGKIDAVGGFLRLRALLREVWPCDAKGQRSPAVKVTELVEKNLLQLYRNLLTIASVDKSKQKAAR